MEELLAEVSRTVVKELRGTVPGTVVEEVR